jgi:hypothetical protein
MLTETAKTVLTLGLLLFVVVWVLGIGIKAIELTLAFAEWLLLTPNGHRTLAASAAAFVVDATIRLLSPPRVLRYRAAHVPFIVLLGRLRERSTIPAPMRPLPPALRPPRRWISASSRIACIRSSSISNRFVATRSFDSAD